MPASGERNEAVKQVAAAVSIPNLHMVWLALRKGKLTTTCARMVGHSLAHVCFGHTYDVQYGFCS